MKILIIDTAASEGGALTILDEQVKRAEKDSNNNYIFLTSKTIKSTSSNIENISIRKPNWIKRFYFDSLGYKKYIRQ